METEAARQNEGERDLSMLERGGGVVIFVSGIEDEDPVSAVTAEVNSTIFPRFSKGDVLEYEDDLNWLKVKVVDVGSDDAMVKYTLKVVKVIAASSFKEKGEVFTHEFARGFGGHHLKRFGDEF